MADKKITELTEETTVESTDVIPLVTDISTTAVTKKATIANLNASILGVNAVFTGRPAFNGGTSGSTPPFTVDSQYLVTNLNADLLEGYSYDNLPYAASSSIYCDDWVAVLGGVGFSNSWVNEGTNAPASYCRSYGDDIVYLKGTVKNGTQNTAIFTLPTGYRPTDIRVFPVNNNGVFGLISIDSGGVVTQVSTTGGSNTSLCLDGIVFR